MLTYRLIKDDGECLVYEYIPEKNGKPGEVSVNRKNGEVIILKESEDDFGKRYSSKLSNRLKSFYDSNEFKENGKICWY